MLGCMSPLATMTTLNAVLGTIFIVLALVFLIVGAMATAGKLPGNNVVGLRVPEVRKNESTWRQAHRVVGPFWILTGVGLALAAAFAFIASGWLWIAPAIAVVASVVALSVGGNFGARAALLVDDALSSTSADSASAGTGAGAAAAPAVDLGALRNAATQADNKAGGQADGQ